MYVNIEQARQDHLGGGRSLGFVLFHLGIIIATYHQPVSQEVREHSVKPSSVLEKSDSQHL